MQSLSLIIGHMNEYAFYRSLKTFNTASTKILYCIFCRWHFYPINGWNFKIFISRMYTNDHWIRNIKKYL